MATFGHVTVSWCGHSRCISNFSFNRLKHFRSGFDTIFVRLHHCSLTVSSIFIGDKCDGFIDCSRKVTKYINSSVVLILGHIVLF